MSQPTIISQILFGMGLVGTAIAAGTLIVSAWRLLRGQPPAPRHMAVIVSMTGLILIALRWLLPAHADALRPLSYLGTGVFLLGAAWIWAIHQRARARLPLKS